MLDYKEYDGYRNPVKKVKRKVINFLKITISTSEYILTAKGNIEGQDIYMSAQAEDDKSKKILELARETVFRNIKLNEESFDIEIDVYTFKATMYQRYYEAKCVYQNWQPIENTVTFRTRIQSIVLALIKLQEITAQDHYEGKLYIPSGIMNIKF